MKGICLQCGAEFKNRRALDFRKKNPQQMFCSKVCAGAYKHEHNPICPECGRRHNGDADGPCCDCKKKMEYEASLHKCCEICGAEFVGLTPQSRRCSIECDKEYARQRAKAYNNALFVKLAKPRICKWCGNKFIPEYGCKKRAYCSVECTDKAFSDAKHARKRLRKKKETINLSAGVWIQPISLRRLWLRDGGVCQICKKKVDWKLERNAARGSDPMCASRDHIIPVSCGGKHTWENVRLAHNKCNRERGVGGNSQLLLFG